MVARWWCRNLFKYNEGKSIAVERFITTFETKIYRYMALILENVYFDKLNDTVNKYSNIYQSTT